MTIHRPKAPCFALDPNPWGDDEASIQHFPSFDDADDELGRLRREHILEHTRVKRVAPACWVAECDGCGELFTDDEDGGSHFGKFEGELEDYLRWDDWTWTVPDGRRCSGCSPEDADVPPPSPAELEAARQMPLPGVAE